VRRDAPAASPLTPAERFDPPLQRQTWRVDARLTRADFLADARERWRGGAESFERVLWHGGLHLNGRPLGLPGELPAGLPSARAGPGGLPNVVEAGSRVTAWGFQREPEPVPFAPDRILLDRHGLIAVDKPAWLPVQATRASQRLCLEAALRRILGCPSIVAVHRLDRQTSGVVLFARTPAVAGRLGRALGRRRIARRYLAVTAPAPAADRFAVEGDLIRVPDVARFRFGLCPSPCRGGRFSRTRFRCLARAAGRAWLEAEPRTGRTHQIRVHLATAGAPIAGDGVYGPPGRLRGAARLQLHAASLCFAFEAGGRELEIEAPLPADFIPPPSPRVPGWPGSRRRDPPTADVAPRPANRPAAAPPRSG
jgi:RluA family pseudouridine synthase